MAHRQRKTWYGQQQSRRNSPFLRRIDRSFRFRLLLASTGALLVLGLLNRAEICRAKDHAPNCVFQDFGSLLSVGNLESYSIATATLLYLLESERRHEQDNREAYETIMAAAQANLVHSISRIRAIETLSDAGCILENLDLHGADLTGLQIPNTQMPRINLSGTVLAHADLRGSDLTGANLAGADLTGANLTGADLTQANLAEANLTGADLSGAKLIGTNLTEANLTEANLTGAEVTDTDLTQAILVRTHLDGATPHDREG